MFISPSSNPARSVAQRDAASSSSLDAHVDLPHSLHIETPQFPSFDTECSPVSSPSSAYQPPDLKVLPIDISSTKSSSCSSVTLHHDLATPSPSRPLTPAPPSPVRLSTARLIIAHFALGMALFLATTDVHLVATSLPTIASELKGPTNLYTWVGVAYILPQTVLQPLWGKVADVAGRKPVLYASIALFLLGSLLCGLAQSMIWLVIARGVAGAGAGGLVPMVWIITGEIVPIEDRAKWSDTLTCVWAASALAGPLLGGVFSQSVSWRWGFFVNIPICVVSALLLLAFLRIELPGRDTRGWKEQMLDLNYAGLGLLVAGTTSMILGFSTASSQGWNKPAAIALLSSGGLGMVAACVQEAFTKRTRFIPVGIFTRSGSILSIGSFFQTFACTAAIFYLALFFQAVTGASAIRAGLLLLPFSLGSALISLVSNLYIRRGGKPKHMVIVGFGITSIGFGLMIMLNEHSPMSLLLCLPLVAGLGMGLLYRSPFAAMERVLPEKDRAPMTACFFLVRFIGTSVGLAAAGALFETRVQQTLPAGFVIDPDSMDWRSLVQIVDPVLRQQVLSCVSAAVSLIWVLCTPLLGISFLLSFFVHSKMPASGVDSVPNDIERQSTAPVDEKGQVRGVALGGPQPDSTTTSTTTLPLSTSRALDGVSASGKSDHLEPIKPSKVAS